MNPSNPEPTLAILKDLKYCDFSEAVYLFGLKRGNLKLFPTEVLPDNYNKTYKEISIQGCKDCQRPFVLRHSLKCSEHDTDTDKFPKNEKLIVGFLKDLWEKLQRVNSQKLKKSELLFSPLPSQTLQFNAQINLIYPFHDFKFFQFQDLVHEVIFSNKMPLEYCERLGINQSNADEYFSHSIKIRNLATQVVSYYLLHEYPKLKWNLNEVVSHPLLKTILEDSYIPISTSHRLIKDEIKKVVPDGVVKSGRPHLSKWNQKQLSQSPLPILGVIERDLSGIYIVNYQALRIVLRVVILARSIMKNDLSVDATLNHPLIQYYLSTLTPKGVELVENEIQKYIQFRKCISK